MFEKLKTLISNPELRIDLGHQARTWVERNREWNTLSKRVVTAYSDLSKLLPSSRTLS